MKFEEQPVTTTCDTCRYIAEQGGTATALDAYEVLKRTQANLHERIAELEAERDACPYCGSLKRAQSCHSDPQGFYCPDCGQEVKSPLPPASDLMERLTFLMSDYEQLRFKKDELLRLLAESREQARTLREVVIDYKDRCRECGGKGEYLVAGSDDEPPDLRQCQWCDLAITALAAQKEKP